MIYANVMGFAWVFTNNNFKRLIADKADGIEVNYDDYGAKDMGKIYSLTDMDQEEAQNLMEYEQWERPPLDGHERSRRFRVAAKKMDDELADVYWAEAHQGEK